MPVRSGYLLLAGGGAILVWSGLKGKSWSTVLQDLIRGNKPSEATQANPIQAGNILENAATLSQSAGTTPGQQAPNGPRAAKNMALGRVLASAYGWSTGQEWADLKSLWNAESGWNNYAYNPSGATGIPQALPASKMPLLARLPSQGGIASASLQISWGLKYIKERWQTPSKAWANEESEHWY